jgi:hypothetical protein
MSVLTYTKADQQRDHAKRNAWFLKVNGREMTYEDVLLSIGARFTGQSQDTGRRNPMSRSSDDGITRSTTD